MRSMPLPDRTGMPTPTWTYAKAGIAFYWRIEQAANGVPLIYTYILDPATGTYRTGAMFTGVVTTSAPFPLEIDLGEI